jgi:hypothetical protein
MVHLGHFSFFAAAVDSGGRQEPLHGYFTFVAEAESVEEALAKFEALILRLHRSHDIFTGVERVHLDSCIEIKSMPKRGFLAYYCEEKGKPLPAIATSLFGVGANYAASYEWIGGPDIEEENSWREPFVIFAQK